MNRYFGMFGAAVAALALGTFGPRDGEAQEWGGLAFGVNETEAGASVMWAFDFGDTEAEAEREALRRCEWHLGAPCRSWGTFANGCAAIAVSECPAESCSIPAYGAGSGTRSEAESKAIAKCEEGAAGVGVAGTCDVDTGMHGEPGTVCVGDPDAAAAPGNARYGVLRGAWDNELFETPLWAFGYSDTLEQARIAAERSCNRMGKCGPDDPDGYFTSLEGSPARCAAIAIFDNERDGAGYGIDHGRTRSEARAGAMYYCGNRGAEGCRVAAVECL